MTKPQHNENADVLSILSSLIEFRTYSQQPNHQITNWIEAYLKKYGIACSVIFGPEGDRANLFATIGPKEVSGYILSGHMDVVPVEGQNWATDPFKLTDVGEGKYAGRGTTDMKGYLASALAMVPYFQSLDLKRPIHIAFSYDEEVGCRGVPNLIPNIPDLCTQPLACLVGEPSDLIPVLSHKGKSAIEITFRGKAAHSSDPSKGENAIYPASELIMFIKDLAERLKKEWPIDKRFSPSENTLVAGVIKGGTAVNIIPNKCVIQLEARSVPSQTAKEITDLIVAKAQELVRDRGSIYLSCKMNTLAEYPALFPCENEDLITMMEVISGNKAQQSVSYGTEAGLFHEAGIPSLICGPGSIERAHRPNEYITESELLNCNHMLACLASKYCCM